MEWTNCRRGKAAFTATVGRPAHNRGPLTTTRQKELPQRRETPTHTHTKPSQLFANDTLDGAELTSKAIKQFATSGPEMMLESPKLRAPFLHLNKCAF